MTWETTQPSLLSRVRDPQDHAAWREFDHCYGGLITRYGRAQGLQQSDAEDVRQIVMMSLASALRSFQYDPARGRFRTYLWCITRNAMQRVQRARRNDGVSLQNLGAHTIAAHARDDDVDAMWEQHWREHHLRIAFDTLRATRRIAHIDVFERLLSGATLREAASEFDMAYEAVKKVQQRIGQRLEAIVAAQIAEEECGPCVGRGEHRVDRSA